MVKLILKFFSVLPLWLNHFIGGIVGRFLYFFNTESKKVVKKNIEACFPNYPKSRQKELIKQALIENGKSLTESSYIWFKSFQENSKKVTQITGLEKIKTDSSIILLVPHFGCWEIVGRVLSLTKPVTFLYKPLRKEKEEELVLSKRQQGDLSMATADKKGVIKLQRAISKGELVGILPDQDPGEEGSVIAPFFNQDVRTMTLLVKLARKNNSKVLLTWAKRLKGGKGYELNLQEVDILSHEGDIEKDVTLMNKAIEDLVITCPEQYLWNYKRFKSIIDYS